jgi:MoxR-like ATPase
MSESELSVEEANARIEDVLTEIESTVIGDREFFEEVLTGILARGHVLMEDVPGTGKTLTANSFATAFGLSFSRIQFTPDLLPNDVVGTNIFNEEEREFEFQRGPIFANVVLADEINRAPPKTQAAMLEAMAERQVTVENETRQLPEPYFVIATQNPVEQEGTFPLPEAQVDRFMVKTRLGYPEHAGERELLERRIGRTDQVPEAEPVLEGAEEVLALQQVPETIHVDDDMLDYIPNVAEATREDHRVRVGVSPRGTQRLLEAVRTRAVMEGREYATPDDVKSVAQAVLAHRLVLTPEAQVNDVEESEIIDDILDEIPVPTVESEPDA